MRADIHACMHACMRTCVHAYMRTYVHTYTVQHELINLNVILIHVEYKVCATYPHTCVHYVSHILCLYIHDGFNRLYNYYRAAYF